MRVTVRELAKLAQHIIATYPEFYKIYGEREFTWNKIRQQNRNPLLAMGIGADGMKTGFTKEAGYGLVGSAVQNGLRLIVVVNGLKSAKERADDAKHCSNGVSAASSSRLLFAEGQTVGEAQALWRRERPRAAGAVGGKPIRLLVPRNSDERIVARVVYSGPVAAPVEKGQRVGTLKVWRGDNVVLEVPLEAGESVGQARCLAARLRCAGRIVRRCVPRRRRAALERDRQGSRRTMRGNSSPSKAARGPASRPRPSCWPSGSRRSASGSC